MCENQRLSTEPVKLLEFIRIVINRCAISWFPSILWTWKTAATCSPRFFRAYKVLLCHVQSLQAAKSLVTVPCKVVLFYSLSSELKRYRKFRLHWSLGLIAHVFNLWVKEVILNQAFLGTCGGSPEWFMLHVSIKWITNIFSFLLPCPKPKR